MTVCAWCGVILRPSEPSFVTHGMCPKCQVEFIGGPGPVSLKEFIRKFDFPIVLVNSNVELIDANLGALELVGKEFHEVEGRLGGDVLECIHATRPGGCGQTVHCKGCAIRIAVRTTLETGRPLIDVDSFQDVMTENGLERMHLKLSTAKRSDTVLLKIVAA